MLGHKFRRQHPLGFYIVDFVCLAEKLVVEVDGGQHDENRDYDERRSRWLEQQGYQVLRFCNHEVLQHLDVVVPTIAAALPPTRPEPGYAGPRPTSVPFAVPPGAPAPGGGVVC